MTKAEHISIRTTSEIKRRLIQAAEKQGRKHTNLAAWIIQQWLDQNHPNQQTEQDSSNKTSHSPKTTTEPEP